MSTPTPGPWIIATSNSWRRIVSTYGVTVCEPLICEPIAWPDGHPDLYFPNGGDDGPDARLLTAAPDMYEALKELYAVVKGECPSLLDEDSGGDSRLALEIESALAKAEGKS